MKVVLVDNLMLPEQGSLEMLDVHPHLGLLALAAAAEADGHRAQIYDPKRALRAGSLPYDATIYERAATDVLAMQPAAVGFTTLGCSFVFAIQTAAALKRREPELPILLGGPHATMLDRPILERFAQFDAIVRHEADETFSAVLDNLERRRFDWLPGLTWRAAGGEIRVTDGKPKVVELDRLPFTSYDHYPIETLGLDLLRIEAGRGCPFACTFCSTAGFFQRSFRLKSPGRLVAELDRLHDRYGVRDFKLDHDMFTVDRRKVIAFCEAVAGRGYRWRVSARVDCVDPPLVDTMARAGCVGLYFGIETGSARMQKICKKRLDLALVAPILEAAEAAGIATTASFITGYPEERADDQDDTLDMIGRSFSPRCLTQLHILAPEPGTPMWDERGATIAYDGYGGPFNAGLVGADDEALVHGHPDLFQTYYYYPGELARAHQVFAVEAVDRLRRAGPIVVGYLLRMPAYGGRLSRLIAALRDFTGDAPPAADDVVAYVAQAFGAAHHVTSLIRYALAESTTSSDDGEAGEAVDLARPYQVNRALAVLPEIHDCGALLGRITRLAPGELLDDEDAGPLGAYALPAAQGRGPRTACWVSPGAQAIAELFDEPRTCDEVERLVCEAVGVAALPAGVFDSLIRVGLIVEPVERAA